MNRRDEGRRGAKSGSENRGPSPATLGRRTALAGLRGGKVERSGDPPVSMLLAHALDVVAGDQPGELTHGFHSYPARFHPLLPRRLLEAAQLPRGARVLDPFSGSGTTLVEAALAGCAGIGVDLNPLAIELGRLKATPWPAARRQALVDAALGVVERVGAEVRAARRRSQPPPGPPRPRRRETRFDDPRVYPPHVYPELVSLKLAIDAIPDEALRRALLLVLTSIVVKVSLQRSDTDETRVERAVPRGAATRHFGHKAEELAGRMAALAAVVPSGTPPPELVLGDARRLETVSAASIALVITSPPYLGTYDYTQHHLRRFGWLGLDGRALAAGEIGARRGQADPARALAAWRKDVAAYVAEIARVLEPGAWAYLLVGDSQLDGNVIPGPVELEQASVAAGLTVVAGASQARGAERSEHLIALRRPAEWKTRKAAISSRRRSESL